VFFNNATGRIHGSGLTEAQTFADLTTGDNRKTIAAALYADGLTSATVLRANAGGSATAKAFLAAGDLGAATAAFLGSADVGTALDALSPEPYGASQIMAWRNSLQLTRALTGAVAAPEGWNAQVGYDQQQATLTASPTTMNGSYDINSSYVIATKGLSRGTQFSVLFSQNQGNTSAPGFSSKSRGQSLGLGFAADLDFARLDLAVAGGKLESDGSRNGQTFSDQSLKGGTALARLSFAKLGAFTPFVGLHYSNSKMDAFTESGTGANLTVAEASQSNTFAEAGLGYALALSEMFSLTLNVAYEHNLGSTGDSMNARFADAATPTSFTVRTYGAGQDIFRGGIGLQANLGAGRSAGISYDVHSGDDLKSAHQIKANYTFRF